MSHRSNTDKKKMEGDLDKLQDLTADEENNMLKFMNKMSSKDKDN